MSPEDWFKSLPAITKSYFVAAVGTTLLISIGAISPKLLYLDFDLVFSHFQVWRIITCFFFFGTFGMPFVFNIVLLVRYFGKLETEHFVFPDRGRSTADMVSLCSFGVTLMMIVAYVVGDLYFLGPSLVFMILYIWSRKDPHRAIDFWGFSLQAWHLPFVLLAMSVVLGNSPVADIIGILVGHLYHFLVDIVPKVYHKELLRTPDLIYQLFERKTGPAANQWQRGGGYRMS